MPNSTLLDTITGSPRLAKLLRWPWDFDVTDAADASWFTVTPPRGLQIIAEDGAGGIFALWGDGTGEDRPVLYADSEGQAGVIAATLAEALQMMIALPYWRDCLKFSGGGDLEQMRRSIPFLENEFQEDEPDIPAFRTELFAGLDLERPERPLDRLHQRLTEASGTVTVMGDDGQEFGPLFGPFVVEDNPLWKS